MMKIYQIVNIGILVTFKISQKNVKVKRCLYFNLIFFSLSKNFDDICMLLKKINTNFNTIVLTELRMKKNSVSSIIIELENCPIEHTPTEIAA